MKRIFKGLGGLAGLALLIIGYLSFWPVAIDPVAWNAPEDKGYVGAFAANTQLANLERLSIGCLLYTSPSPRDRTRSRMPSSA